MPSEPSTNAALELPEQRGVSLRPVPSNRTSPPSSAPPLPFLQPWRDKTVLFLALLSLIVHFSFITRFTGKMDIPETKNSSYDSLAEHLLRGRTTVDATDIGDEQMTTKRGEPCMYFAPFPALLRFVNLMFESMRGKWARSSCLIASMLTLTGLLAATMAHLSANRSLTQRDKRHYFFLTFAGLSFGSILLFLISWGSIYHEAILWGSCFGSWGLYFATGAPRSLQTVVWMSIIAACALLSRITFGISMSIILLGLIVRDRDILVRGDLPTRVKTLLLVLGPFGLACSFQGWYNYDRFGSPFTFLDFSTWQFNPDEFGGTFALGRIPAALYNYFWIRPEYFQSHAPFVVMPKVVFFNEALHYADYREWNVSLLVVSPWLLYGAARGLVPLLRHGWFPMLALGACTAHALIIMCNFFITMRYSADLLPMLFLPYLYFLRTTKETSRPLGAIILGLLCACSVATTTLSTLAWSAMKENWGTTSETKTLLNSAFLKIDKSMGIRTSKSTTMSESEEEADVTDTDDDDVTDLVDEVPDSGVEFE